MYDLNVTIFSVKEHYLLGQRWIIGNTMWIWLSS